MLEHSEFQKQRLFGIDFDVLTMQDAVDWVFRTVAIGRRTATRYVVTPNVNLTMLHQDLSQFRRVVHDADLTIVDGMPLVVASRWLGKRLPERVAGSDLVFTMFAASVEEMPLKVFLLGAAPGVGDRAAEVVASRWPGIEVVGTLSPGYGFERELKQNEQILATIRAADPDVLIVGLGSPKQELWAHTHREQISAPVTLCVGGTIDLIAGEQKRAPEWFRRTGMEWFWRVVTNPRRLLTRYVRDGVRLPRLLLDEISGLCPSCQNGNTSETASNNSVPAQSMN